mmetsp:Transcript_4886/g.17710  ORF Transcript_4886/g.17710 Transcript_4886/m.17710 type:complete len:332 (-) Transcript_4886:691-1686(-)
MGYDCRPSRENGWKNAASATACAWSALAAASSYLISCASAIARSKLCVESEIKSAISWGIAMSGISEMTLSRELRVEIAECESETSLACTKASTSHAAKPDSLGGKIVALIFCKFIAVRPRCSRSCCTKAVTNFEISSRFSFRSDSLCAEHPGGLNITIPPQPSTINPFVFDICSCSSRIYKGHSCCGGTYTAKCNGLPFTGVYATDVSIGQSESMKNGVCAASTTNALWASDHLGRILLCACLSTCPSICVSSTRRRAPGSAPRKCSSTSRSKSQLNAYPFTGAAFTKLKETKSTPSDVERNGGICGACSVKGANSARALASNAGFDFPS